MQWILVISSYHVSVHIFPAQKEVLSELLSFATHKAYLVSIERVIVVKACQCLLLHLRVISQALENYKLLF